MEQLFKKIYGRKFIFWYNGNLITKLKVGQVAIGENNFWAKNFLD